MLDTKIAETLAFLSAQTAYRPDVALVLGSGLGALGDQLEQAVSIPYEVIPHFQSSTAPGHNGRMILGMLQGKTVLCMQGRLHCYEGYSMQEVTYPIRVISALDVRTLILTNACGGLDPSFAPGDLMVVTDHVNFMGTNPLIGPNEESFGPRFPDMTRTYTQELVQLAKDCATDLEMVLREGTYLACTGPSYETPAEIRLFQRWGMQGVGMSTVPEAIVASHCGLQLLAISCITNLAAGILDVPLTGEEVVEVAGRVSHKFIRLLSEILRRLP